MPKTALKQRGVLDINKYDRSITFVNTSSTRVIRLSWAGIRIECAGEQLVVDAIEGRDGVVQSRIGRPREPLLPIAARPVDVAALTHLHFDHYDADALRRRLAPGARVVVPARVAGEVERAGFNAAAVADGESVQAGRFRLTALPAVDGIGSPQVSWLVEAGGLRVVHAGDTMYHGYWWQMARMSGPLDVAFLPINGVRLNRPDLEPSGLPIVMTAEQAAVAGRLLKAKLTVPMHYREFYSPPVYNPDLDAEASFIHHAKEQGLAFRLAAPGETVLAA
jgi:L-ascorbate metabolism protein UlaG (beta-lactamase superfamily)